MYRKLRCLRSCWQLAPILILVLGVVLLGKAVIGFLTSASISFLFHGRANAMSAKPLSLADGALANMTVALAVLHVFGALVSSFEHRENRSLGVQEAGYVLIGQLLGLPIQFSLSLSLVKRIPDLLLGLPGLLTWHTLETHHLLLRRGAGPPQEAGRNGGGAGSIVLLAVVTHLIRVKTIAPVITIASLMAGPTRILISWKLIEWPVVRWYLPGAITGAIIGSWFFTWANAAWLRIIVGLFLVSMPIQYRFGTQARSFPMRLPWFIPVSVAVGVISGVIGASSLVTQDLSADPLFEIGNHSYSHPGFRSPCYGLGSVQKSNQAAEVQKTDALLKKYSSSYKKYFRFPGLCFAASDVERIEAQDYTVIGGDVYGGDGFKKNPAKIVLNVLVHVRPGSIVILHMHGGPNAPETAKALPDVIRRLRLRGYTFVKVSDLLGMSRSKD